MNIYSLETVVKNRTEVQTAKIHDNYLAVHITQSYERISAKNDGLAVPRRKLGATISQYVMHKDNLGVYLRGGNLNQEPDVLPVTDEQLEVFQTRGYMAGHESMEDRVGAYDAALNGGYNFIRTNTSTWEISDLDGIYMVIPIIFNYIDGNMDNEKFDLAGVLKSFIDRTDIIWDTFPLIEDIPYYNASFDRSKCLSFSWIPTPAQYILIANKGSWERYQTITDHDMLGINKFARRPSDD